MQKRTNKLYWIGVCLLLLGISGTSSQAAYDVRIARVATGLNNPRGIVVMPQDRLLVVEAGTGVQSDDPALFSGRISIFEDLNHDGDYDDPGEMTPILSQLPSYNALTMFGTQSDEVGGAGDVIVLVDGTILFTKDDPRQKNIVDGNSSDIGVGELSADFTTTRTFIRRFGTVNGLAYDENSQILYLAESGSNRLIAVNSDGKVRTVANFAPLAHGQQAVPAGLALDPRNGDVLVALFSGSIRDYFGQLLPFMPGDAKIVRVDPLIGTQSDEIAGLTTAVDVAINEDGDIFVVEFTTNWPPAMMPEDFDLYDSAAPPDPGGYTRFAGRVSLYPVGGTDSVILAAGLDTPSNITYHEGNLYVSTGQGTPGRRVFTSDGITQITGEIYRITVTQQ